MFAEGMNTQEDVIFTFVFPENKITVIKSYAFHMLSSLRAISIPNSVTTIEAGAFANSGLVTLSIPSSLTAIGNLAFSASSSLTTLTYLGKTPNDVTTVGKDIFVAFTKLTTLKVPNALNIDDEKWKTFLGYSFQTVTK